MHEARIARTLGKAVFVNFAAKTMVAAVVTLLHKVTMQAAAPELHCAVAERSQKVEAVVPATTAARQATLMPSAQISRGKYLLPPRNSSE
jgi:hypothetical protein